LKFYFTTFNGVEAVVLCARNVQDLTASQQLFAHPTCDSCLQNGDEN
jgi:hypothetical protein